LDADREIVLYAEEIEEDPKRDAPPQVVFEVAADAADAAARARARSDALAPVDDATARAAPTTACAATAAPRDGDDDASAGVTVDGARDEAEAEERSARRVDARARRALSGALARLAAGRAAAGARELAAAARADPLAFGRACVAAAGGDTAAAAAAADDAVGADGEPPRCWALLAAALRAAWAGGGRASYPRAQLTPPAALPRVREGLSG